MAQGTSQTIAEILAKGEVLEGHRSRDRARALVPDLKKTLQLPGAADPALDPLLEEFIVEVVLGAAWYEKKYHGAARKVWFYIALNALLIIGLPLALVGLGSLPSLGPTSTVVSQITGVLTGILALQKTLSTWYASQQRYAVWYKAAADLKSLYYALLQEWASKAATDHSGFVAALATATTAGRKIIDDEEFDFYQKLAMPSFDVLDMLTSTRGTVSTFVTSLLPGTPNTTVSAAGKSALTSSPSAPPTGGATGATGAMIGAASTGVVVRAAGATKPNDNPYTIVIVASPAIETLSGQIVADPILQSPSDFDARVQYVIQALFGQLPGQAETFLAPFGPQIRVISIFDPTRPAVQANALVKEFVSGGVIEPVQSRFGPLMAQYQYNGRAIKADVALAVTACTTRDRSSAHFTYDNDSGAGVAFQIDGHTLTHRYTNIYPGVVALHTSATSVVALHEFSHAASSWSNGCVQDLYVDEDMTGGPVNIRVGRPIPANFATYAGKVYASDPARDSLGYDPSWRSFHCALVDPTYPALMDNFWLASNQRPELCKHDQITVAFLTDRIRAIMSRP